MDSSSSSMNHTISLEELKLFHTIDRAIFSRLVLNLQRQPFESMHVMALFLWLENYSCTPGLNLVYNIQPWSDPLINALADEAVQCLICLNTDEFPFSHFHDDKCTIPLIRKLTGNEISLRFFHENRVEIVCRITQLVRHICLRAFDDIMKLIHDPLIMPVYSEKKMGNQQNLKPNLGFLIGAQRSNEMEDLWKGIHNINIKSLEENNGKKKENKEVEADDRTVFLTFSKGYSVSEAEVRDFFTRKFGKIFEGIEMQEVVEGEQPLYAKLVVKYGSDIEMILNGKQKAKFSINGKHVWARKYVRKNHKSSPSKVESHYLQ
ncbi:hypothetical protein E1A91_A13G023100v1 [Gossypium mustelinum]|uniref:RRM domain-containing protein n=1 Tax=Gossypium mustelinum TaxID=34275 RepID=A0A5D2WDJ8_GOSMU|nr:hypothetical protein E1A91_A13G023100v1 [Gossypium mustelinum]